MNLISETLFISLSMILLCALPLLSDRIRQNSRLFFLLGTGALAGICFFDLLPDVFEMGGHSSLWAIGAVWIIYSVVHLFHLGHHEHEQGKPHQEHSILFLGSMIAHCLASGMLLVISSRMAGGFGKTVFFALLAHKAYEALTVSSILIEKQRSRAESVVSIVIYALSLPSGVVLTILLGSRITPSLALLATSLAVGALLGCLFYDFLLPSLSHIKKRRMDISWVVIGLLLTQVVMRFV